MIRNQRGFTMIENLLAVLIGIIAFAALSTGLFYIKKISNGVQVRSTEEKQVLQIVENLRASIENQQITFDVSDQAREKMLRAEVLPMAWSQSIVTEVNNCADCPGRFGYVIQPYDGMRGLYRVTVRFTYRGWDVPYKDYQFVVSVR